MCVSSMSNKIKTVQNIIPDTNQLLEYNQANYSIITPPACLVARLENTLEISCSWVSKQQRAAECNTRNKLLNSHKLFNL